MTRRLDPDDRPDADTWPGWPGPTVRLKAIPLGPPPTQDDVAVALRDGRGPMIIGCGPRVWVPTRPGAELPADLDAIEDDPDWREIATVDGDRLDLGQPGDDDETWLTGAMTSASETQDLDLRTTESALYPPKAGASTSVTMRLTPDAIEAWSRFGGLPLGILSRPPGRLPLVDRLARRLGYDPPVTSDDQPEDAVLCHACRRRPPRPDSIYCGAWVCLIIRTLDRWTGAGGG